MTRRRRNEWVLIALVFGALGLAALAGGRPVPGAPSCPMTPANSFWHADVSALPVLPQSSTWVASIGTTAGLKADFGSGLWDGGPIGIPYTTVPGTQPRVPVTFDYADESDPGPYPVPPDAPVEGGSSSTGDRHVLIVDRDACRLWELYDAYPQNGGTSWTAGSGATWDLNSNAMRTLGWTSGDAAGLPILPGLVRYDEVAAGDIDHVIRFTAPRTAPSYVWPASHKAGTGGSSDPPMGTWFRLKASFDISGFSAQDQVILRALKKHGMILADNGSPWYLSGVPDPSWNNSDLAALRSVPGSAFEAVDVSSLKVSNTSYAVTSGSPPPPPPPPPPPTQLVANPGFETGLNGWRTGDKRTTLAQVCTVAHSSSCSAQLGRTRNGNATLDDFPDSVASTVKGATYTGSLWLLAPVGRSLTLRVREYRGTTLVHASTATVTSTGAWQHVSVTSAAAAGGTTLGIDTYVSLTTALRADVDDVSLVAN